MLERTSVVINDKEIEVRIEVGMPQQDVRFLEKCGPYTYKWLTKDSRSSHHVSKY